MVYSVCGFLGPVVPVGGTVKSPGRGRQQMAVCSRPGILLVTAVAKDGWPYNVRQICVWERAGLRGTAGQSFCTYFVCQISINMCKKQ